MNFYTVVIMFHDECIREESSVKTIAALTPTHAAHRVREALAAEVGCDPTYIEVLAVFEGKHRDVYEPIVDTPERNEELDNEMEEMRRNLFDAYNTATIHPDFEYQKELFDKITREMARKEARKMEQEFLDSTINDA